jgi:hypothetical protein
VDHGFNQTEPLGSARSPTWASAVDHGPPQACFDAPCPASSTTSSTTSTSALAYLGIQAQRLGLDIEQLVARPGNYHDRHRDFGISALWQNRRCQHQEGFSGVGSQLPGTARQLFCHYRERERDLCRVKKYSSSPGASSG